MLTVLVYGAAKTDASGETDVTLGLKLERPRFKHLNELEPAGYRA